MPDIFHPNVHEPTSGLFGHVILQPAAILVLVKTFLPIDVLVVVYSNYVLIYIFNIMYPCALDHHGRNIIMVPSLPQVALFSDNHYIPHAYTLPYTHI